MRTVARLAKVRSVAKLGAAFLVAGLHCESTLFADAADDLVHVHVSAELLAREAARSIDREVPVRDNILGVPVRGKARLTGSTSLKLLEGREKGVFELVLIGSAKSTTQAHAGKATIHSRTVTSFTARKRIVLDEQGLHAQPAMCRAVANSTITGVSSPLPGLRGRLARRVAWRRAQSMRIQTDRISARHSEQTIGGNFDAEIARDVGQTNAWLAGHLKTLSVAGNPFHARFRTSSDGLRVTGLSGSLADLAAAQDSLKKSVAVGLLFENDHLVLTVGLPQTKANTGVGLAESQEPTISDALGFLKLAPRPE